MADVFISYAREDRETAHRLADRLAAYGWSVWWDRDIPLGDTYDTVIERELNKARAAVVLWSSISLQSDWVKNEASSALEQKKLVPVLIEDIKLSLEFRRVQAAQMVGWAGDPAHEGFRTVVANVARLAGRPPAEPQPAPPKPAPVPEPRPKPAPSAAPTPEPAPPAPPVDRRAWLPWVGGGAALLVAAVAGWQFLAPSADRSDPNPPVPAAVNPPPAAPAADGCTVVVADPQPPLNVRSGPGEASAQVGQLANGTALTVAEQQGGWLRITQPVRGWVSANMTRQDCGALPGRFPQASQRLLTDGDLAGLDARDLRIMRNEIYARKGYIFQNPDLSRYFSEQPWYRPRISGDVPLTAIEQQNVMKIKTRESE